MESMMRTMSHNRRSLLLFLGAAVFLSIFDCGGDTASASCYDVLVPAQSGGCSTLRLDVPLNCETIDLSNGRSYTAGWTTDGAWCDTPWRVYVAGNPVDLYNWLNISYDDYLEDIDAGIGHYGGILSFTAADLAATGVTSVDGMYSWTVESVSGSRPASRSFFVTTNATAYSVSRLSSGTYYLYNAISAAYANAVSGDVIFATATSFDGGLFCDKKDVLIVLLGGYAPGFGAVTGYTTINGGMTIAEGTVVANMIALQ